MKSNWAVRSFAAILVLALSQPGVTEGKDRWAIQPEMRLAPDPESVVPAGKTVVRFGFEKGLDGWRSRHPDVKVEQRSDAGRAGKGGLRIQGLDPADWSFITSPLIPVEPGKKCRASMWVRIESIPEGSRPLYFEIKLVRESGKDESRVPSGMVPPDTLNEWVRIQAEFEVPADCHRLSATIEKGTNTPAAIDASIDEFLIEEIPEFTGDAVLRKGDLAGPITAKLAHVHPRIYLTAERLRDLRAQIHADPRWNRAQQALFQIADRGVRDGPPDYDKEVEKARNSGAHGVEEQLWQRPVGNMIPHLALAYLLSDDQKYLDAARRWISASLSYQTWGQGETDGMDLAAGHQLAGIGLAYDWLYRNLSAEERDSIRQGVVKRAGAMARAILARRVWWERSYLQNHLWVNAAGLATAGFALCDEIDEARGWIRLVHEKFLTTLAILGDDGASHEGYGYWEYGAEYILRYMEMAHDLLGTDLYRSRGVDHPWLVQSPLYALYLALPRAAWTRRQSIVDIGDCPREHWYGPSYILRNLARRYPASPCAGVAQWLASQVESAGIDAPGNAEYLNLVWYDPAIAQATPEPLPTLHHFEDIGIVSSRSDWSGHETLLVVKCGPPLGHRQIHATYDYGAGHVHPDAGHFVFFCGGQFLFRDDGYAYQKLTGSHSTILLDGRGQKGEGKTWFDYEPWLRAPRAPRILSVESSRDVDRIVCDAAPAYPPDLGLKKFIRTFRFSKPSRLEVRDELESEKPVMFEARFQVEGDLQKVSATEYRLAQKNVTALFKIEEPAEVNADICGGDSARYLSLTPREKQTRAQFKVVITVEH